MLLRVKQGLLAVPPGVDICEFLQLDGKPPDITPATIRGELTLGELRDRYLDTHRNSLETNTIVTIGLHFKHVVACLAEKFHINTLTLADLQNCLYLTPSQIAEMLEAMKERALQPWVYPRSFLLPILGPGAARLAECAPRTWTSLKGSSRYAKRTVGEASIVHGAWRCPPFCPRN